MKNKIDQTSNGKRNLLRVMGFIFMFYISAAAQATITKMDGLEWQRWPRVGEAQFTWFVFDVYHSTLFAPQGKYQVGSSITPHPLALEIHYQRDISKQQLLDATDEQWQALGYAKLLRRKGITLLDGLFRDVKKGDRLTYVTDGQKGQLWFQGAQETKLSYLGHVEEQWLNDAFLSIWLSPSSQYPQYRAKLIGQ